jgi:hypothetical protein
MNLRHVATYALLGSMALGHSSCRPGSPDQGTTAESGGSSGNPGSGGDNTMRGGASSGGGNSSSGGSSSSGGGSISVGGGANSGGGSANSSGSGTRPSGGASNTTASGGVGKGGTDESTTGGYVGSGGKTGTTSTGGKGGTATGGAGASDSGGSGLGTGGASAGGSGGSGTGGAGVGGGGSQATCSIAIKTKSLSTVIPTVGIVEWSTDLAGVTEANIEFGLDTNYGMTAPVDLKETNYRTVILGMKAGGKTYHFRVVAKAGEKVCTGTDSTLPATGDPPNSLPQLTFTPSKPSGLDGGFLVLESFKQAFGASGDGAAYIIDQDGDFVWWYVVKGFVDLSRAKQSFDGKYMWITTVNVMSNTQKMIRVKMDGTDAQDLTSEFGNTNHDFAVRSDETIAFIAYGSNNCDDIKERSPSGTVTPIINSGTAVGGSACHCNAIQYDRNDDTIVFSELDTSSIVKVTRDTKKVVWLMSSQNSAKATVTGISWTNQHGMHIVDKNHLLFFNNNTGPNSAAIEAELSITSGKGTAKQIWSYPSNITVQYMGDVQRLGNGNTLVTFSTGGEIREISPSGTLLQTIKVSGSGNLVGFTEKRKSLYGPPPR